MLENTVPTTMVIVAKKNQSGGRCYAAASTSAVILNENGCVKKFADTTTRKFPPPTNETIKEEKILKPGRRFQKSCPTISNISAKVRGSRASIFAKAQNLAAKIIPLNANENCRAQPKKQRSFAFWSNCKSARHEQRAANYKSGESKRSTTERAISIPFVSVELELEGTASDVAMMKPDVSMPTLNSKEENLQNKPALNRNHLSLYNMPPRSAEKSSSFMTPGEHNLYRQNSHPSYQYGGENATDRPPMDFLQIGNGGNNLLAEQISGSSQLSLGASAITPTHDALAGTFTWLNCDTANDNNNNNNKNSSSSYGGRSYANSECSVATTVSQVQPATVAALIAMASNNSNILRPNSFDELLRNALLQVSVDTMAITALPLDCWLKERLKNWVQLSGHAGTIVPASNHTLWKKQPNQNTTEAVAYAKIMQDVALVGLTPKFYKEITHNKESFIEIQDLLAQFPNTSSRAIMDIKIGIRTFMESEVLNTTKRTDLYRKMVDIAPDEPTDEEKADEAITKLRYMQFRERESSTASLGFRIEAAQLPGGKLQKSFKKVHTKQQVMETLIHFFGERHAEIRVQLAERLRKMRDGIEKSHFFKTHEVVGSSILIVYDERKCGAWMIDFAKSTTVPDSITLNHRTQWKSGNHEDGYLIGLENLIDILEMAEKESKRIPPLTVLAAVNK